MAADRNVILTWLADLAAALVSDPEDAADFARRVAVAAALPADGFAAEAMDLMRVVAESIDGADGFGRIVPPASADGETGDAAAVMVAIGLAIAGARIDWPSRPRARAARQQIADAGERGLAVASAMGGDGAELYGWLSSVISTSVRVVSDLAANAVPVVRVETGLSLPSTVLAYKLYGDAGRAQEIVDISGTMTPAIMPTSFEALAS
ncbi:hypothetical protein [Rhizobium sp. RU36D]|uniref:hypothetical protein n=1 Tax=Rhizobium sp. RU36D TaxID=1907415 RepID=UPI0009D845C6|nr:hypothetical protein [Rhizobium sp. RU36D]SMD18472.1 hypothetical protein SAMN05880593_13511 [Rhizobium sp. RU36D]